MYAHTHLGPSRGHSVRGGLMATCMAVSALGALMFPSPSQAKNYKQLYAFQGAPGDGAKPLYGLVKYKGEFYGTTQLGGSGSCSNGAGCGTIFKVTAKGAETPLYSFTGGNDGAGPDGPLVADRSGNFYDAVYEGGSGACTGGCGTVVKLAPDGQLTVLHTFQGGSDGAAPELGVIRDSKGNLYGTTSAGGGGDCSISGSPPGCGTVFKISAKGKETILHAFQGGPDGSGPQQTLLLDSNGNLYGTTQLGGAGAACGDQTGCGTVFKLAADGTETVLYSFCSQANCSDGWWPMSLASPLIADGKGNLYATTYQGGANGQGAVFELSAQGTETVLYSFCAQQGCSDGAHPYSGLVAGEAGNFYGATQNGGEDKIGVVFKLAPDGAETVLHAFAGGNDGRFPTALMQDRLELYGSAENGGGNANCPAGCGTIFKVRE